MQGLTGGVQSHCHLVLHDRHTNQERCSVLREPFLLVALLHALYHGFFYNTLDIRRAEQLTLYGVRLRHPELTVFRDIPLPRKRLGLFEQLLKRGCLNTMPSI